MTPSSNPPERLRVTVWGEAVHERTNPAVASVYPRGMHADLADAIREHADPPVDVRTVTLGDAEHGLPADLLDRTDVLVWWAHAAHEEVPDELAANVQSRVLGGMGLVALHSACLSKPFLRLMGTSCTMRWREGDDRELVWVVNPAHPIARGLPPVIDIPAQEMYGEPFDIPAPDELVFISSFSGGEVFRSGCCFHRGAGRIFYFSPGHETHPVYLEHDVRRAIANGVLWARPEAGRRMAARAAIESPRGWFERKGGAP